jgi:hypothetical protein
METNILGENVAEFRILHTSYFGNPVLINEGATRKQATIPVTINWGVVQRGNAFQFPQFIRQIRDPRWPL